MANEYSTIDFEFFADLARSKGICVEVVEGERLFRFRPDASLPKLHEKEPTPTNPPKVMTPEALAKRWSCSERHVRNMINAGQVQSFKVGGKIIRILLEDVIRFEASNDFPVEAPNTSEPVSEQKPKRKKPARRLDVWTPEE